MTTDPTPQSLLIDRPRYLRETPNGWEGADHQNGPWRPIPAPQTQPPFPVAAGPASDWPTLQWTENMPPCEECRYDHCIAETPFGRFLITWKSWKEYDAPTVDETPWGDWWKAFNSVDEAKAACQKGMDERLAKLSRPAAPPATEPPPTIRYEFEITDEHGQTVASGDAPNLEFVEREGRRYLAQYQHDGPCTLELRRVEVLEVSSPEPAPAAAAEPPLWRVMDLAYSRRWPLARKGYAAEILAVRDRVAPEDGPRPGFSWPMQRAVWDERQAIRALLTAEAARAEAGE